MRKTYCVKVVLLVEMNYQRFFEAYEHIFICRAVDQKKNGAATPHLHACGLNYFNKSPVCRQWQQWTEKSITFTFLLVDLWYDGLYHIGSLEATKCISEMHFLMMYIVYNYERKRSLVSVIKGNVCSTWNWWWRICSSHWACVLHKLIKFSFDCF